MRFKWIVFVVGLVALSSFAFYGLFDRSDEVSHIVAPVTKVDMESLVLATGPIVATGLVDVGAQVNGQVKTIHVRLGDKVKKGQVLVEIDPELQENALSKAKASRDLVLAQQKAKEKARQREIKLEQERQDQHKRELLRAKQEQEARNKEAHDKALRDKLAREKKLQEDQKRTEAAKAAESKRLAELRRQQLERIARMASQSTGNGDASSAGTAARSSGPSASYAGRIAARIKPNITYTDPIVGNPVADVEVRTSPDGTIISRRLVKSSGVKSWDDAVLAAIDKTEKIPADVDGRVIPSLTLGFRPRD